jgi:hypothetical protein
MAWLGSPPRCSTPHNKSVPALRLAIFSAIATSYTNQLLAGHHAPNSALTAGFHRALLAAAIFLLAAALIALRTHNPRGQPPELQPEPEHQPEQLTSELLPAKLR